jgi:hypothetical protein
MTKDNPGTLPTSCKSNFAENMPNQLIDYIQFNYKYLP